MNISRIPTSGVPFTPYEIVIEVTSHSEAYALKTMMKAAQKAYPGGSMEVDAQKIIDRINEDLKV